ncbi:MAG: DUF2785 domain-containing protein [Henriciella sp.]|nr:DUF2785 domain-containing protein [Henriciella sp.]
MRNTFISLLLATLTSACASTQAQTPPQSDSPVCTLAEQSTDVLNQWRENGFEDQLTDTAARDFASCLGAASPFLRDQIGYEGLTAALRSGNVSEATRRDLIADLSVNLETIDEAGFLAPFSALALSELARTDRVEAFLSPAERTALAQTAANYLAGVSDFRAYSDTEGWRHGVAHGADIAMQLALNPNVETADLRTLKGAITSQITARTSHAFSAGEPERLARPIFFMAPREVFTDDEWADWFSALADPAPMADWSGAFKSEIDLARLHNLKAFARVIYINASLSENEALIPLATGSLEMLKTLP